MADTTKIPWCDATFNPWIGCTKISPGCDNCYAERDFDHRRHFVEWGRCKARRRTSDANWKKPLAWNRKCEREGRRMTVFAGSLCDVGDPEAPQEWFDDLVNLACNTPRLTWLFLTKRPETLARRWQSFGIRYPANVLPGCDAARNLPPWPLPNVWMGTTVENQAAVDERIPMIDTIPSAGCFISVEPMLGPVDISRFLVRFRCFNCHDISLSRVDGFVCPSCGEECLGSHHFSPSVDWVICGGETGPNARPMHPDWPMLLRDQCREAEVPFFFKQWGEWAPAGKRIFENARMVLMGDKAFYHIGKDAAGGLLDGQRHHELPERFHDEKT